MALGTEVRDNLCSISRLTSMESVAQQPQLKIKSLQSKPKKRDAFEGRAGGCLGIFFLFVKGNFEAQGFEMRNILVSETSRSFWFWKAKSARR